MTHPLSTEHYPSNEFSPVRPADLTEFITLQAATFKDECANCREDLIAFKNGPTLIVHIELNQGRHYYQPYRGRRKALVTWLPNRLPKLWIDIAEDHRASRRAFRNYLGQDFGIQVSNAEWSCFAVDHVYPRIFGKTEGVGISSLFLVDREVNKSWGNWEHNFVRNDPRPNRSFAPLLFSQMLKLSGFRKPDGPITEVTVAAAASHLWKAGLLPDQSSNFYLGLRHLLYRGNYVSETDGDRTSAVQQMLAGCMALPTPEHLEGWNLGWSNE